MEPDGRRNLNRFEETTFRAYVKGGRFNNQGELELTLAVPVTDKPLAYPLTDVPGLLLTVHCARLRRAHRF